MFHEAGRPVVGPPGERAAPRRGTGRASSAWRSCRRTTLVRSLNARWRSRASPATRPLFAVTEVPEGVLDGDDPGRVEVPQERHRQVNQRSVRRLSARVVRARASSLAPDMSSTSCSKKFLGAGTIRTSYSVSLASPATWAIASPRPPILSTRPSSRACLPVKTRPPASSSSGFLSRRPDRPDVALEHVVNVVHPGLHPFALLLVNGRRRPASRRSRPACRP